MARPLSLNNILRKIEQTRNSTSIVFTSGVFDLFHFGHVSYLLKCKQYGDILIVHVDGDLGTSKRKGIERPYVDENNRAKLIKSLEFVDYVYCSNRPPHDKSILKSIKPDVIVRTVRSKENTSKKIAKYKKNAPKARVILLKPTKSTSSTELIKKIQNPINTVTKLTKTEKKLLDRARATMKFGHSYSGFKIGVSIETVTGKIYSACNCSNASPKLTCCAEEFAILQAVSKGEKELRRLVLVSNSKDIAFPCGSCRQIIKEFSNPASPVVILISGSPGTRRKIYKTNIDKLLPYAFVSQRNKI